MESVIPILLAAILALPVTVGQVVAPAASAPAEGDERGTFVGDAAVHVPAVPLDESQGGMPTIIRIHAEPGNGGVFLETEPLSEPNFQVAARAAVSAAANATGVNASRYDVFVRVEAPLATVIEGPSAGAAMAVAVAAAFLGADVRPDVAITGTVYPDGRVGTVGALDRKADAAQAGGARTFIVPTQAASHGDPLTPVQVGPGVFVLNPPDPSPGVQDLEAQFNLTVVPVSNVGEALPVALVNGNETMEEALGSAPATLKRPGPDDDGDLPVSGSIAGLGVGTLAAVALLSRAVRDRGFCGRGR